MNNFISKTKLLATTAICAISMCANTVKAEEISISEILNNSTTKSPDITWTTEGATSDDIEILGTYYKYIISDNPTRTKYDERKTDLTGDVTADFIGSEYETYPVAYGGAIYNNSATISSITGDFTNNRLIANIAYGGTIYNSNSTKAITGNFINNIATGDIALGGAIYNSGTMERITSNFVGNSAIGNRDGFGGAILNEGYLISITGSFISNRAITTAHTSGGGAINNKEGTIKTINGDFISNSVIGYLGAYGGAIYNSDTIENITGNFIGNTIITEDDLAIGGAISNEEGIIKSITGNFTGNSATSTLFHAIGGAIANGSTIESIHGNFIGNSAIGIEAYGGVIYNYNTIDRITGDFVGNKAISTNSNAKGGAIYNGVGTINFVADASDSTDTLQDDILFQGNYVQVANKDIKYEAIYNKGLINFESNNGGSYTFYDYIDGENPGTLNFVSDDNEGATINLYNNIQNQANINFQNKYVLNMISPDDIHDGTSKYSYIQAQSININAALQMMLDVDLESAEMDRFEADNFTISATGSIDVTKFNIVTDVTGDIGTTTEVEFILSDNTTGLDKITNVTEAVGELYTYSVTFNPETGAFEFVSTGLAPEPVEPSTPAPEEVAPNQAPALTTTTTVATVETVVAQIFDRDVTISTDINYGADTTDYMETSDGVNVTNDKSVWVKTFGSDDDVKVENFNSTIDAEAYGVVGGVDSKVFTYDNGVKAAYGVYGAYVGGKQKYNDSKITQDSGYLGVSAAFRKNNLFSNFTLNGGYITSEANTEWGTDKFDTKTISVANKTGIDIKTHNNWKITPALYVAYTGMDTEDYTNKAGVKMENEFSNVITIAPELKVSNRIGKDLDGYAKVSYKHYIYDAEVRADDVLLEEMSAKPYVEYGFGVEKNWADKSGYAEITHRSGGREGWNINLGLNFDF